MASQAPEASAVMPSTMDVAPSPTPVELSTLPQTSLLRALHPADHAESSTTQSPLTALEPAPEPTLPAAASTEASSTLPDSTTATVTAPAPLTRTQTEALGPATEATIAPPTAAGPVLSITLMLTTGARHPYKIDEKYLKNRNAEVQLADGTFDPRALSGYKLKELIWTDWRNEWEARPAAPGSIRLIIWGKMIDDKKTLTDYNFTLETTNVVHMTIKPSDFDNDYDAAGGKHIGKGGSIRARDGGESGAGCRCVIL